MPYQIALLDGQPAFGMVTSFQPSPIPARRQIDQYFGVPGRTSLFGGGLGWILQISAVFQQYNIALLNADIAFLTTYIDQNTHTVLDTSGNTWPNVVFNGEISFDPRGPMVTDTGWMRAYSLTMETLSP